MVRQRHQPGIAKVRHEQAEQESLAQEYPKRHSGAATAWKFSVEPVHVCPFSVQMLLQLQLSIGEASRLHKTPLSGKNEEAGAKKFCLLSESCILTPSSCSHAASTLQSTMNWTMSLEQSMA